MAFGYSSGVLAPRMGLAQPTMVVSAAVLVASVLVLGGGTVGPSVTITAGASRLTVAPFGLQSVVQQVVGASDREFRVGRRGGMLVASGAGIASVFGPSRVQLNVAGSTVDLRLLSVGYGDRLAKVAPAAPISAGNLVSYSWSDLVEWYRNGPFGLEQGFTLSSGPRGGSGPLTLALSLRGSLVPRLSSRGVAFTSTAGAQLLRYGGLSVVDASGRRLRSALGLSGGRLLVRVWDRGARFPLHIDPFIQQGSKLTGGGEAGPAQFGSSVALSADGKTALIGAPADDTNTGAAWIFTRSGSTWKQQARLTAKGERGPAEFGSTVALSIDGNTALIGAPYDNNGTGAAWVFTRSGSTWKQRAKLTGSGESRAGASFGSGLALSGDGNTALIGGPADHGNIGAAWVFTRSGSAWKQRAKLTAKRTGREATYLQPSFGSSATLSANGSVALIGAPYDGYESAGSTWVFTRSGTTWKQRAKLTGIGGIVGEFGASVALSSDGATALIGAPDSAGASVGSTFVFTGSGSTWKQRARLTGKGETGSGPEFGGAVALSGDGKTALVGGDYDDIQVGAAWVFTDSGSTWKQQGAKQTGVAEAPGGGEFGASVALSDNGTTALIGGPQDNNLRGAAWWFEQSCGLACATPHTPVAPVVSPPPSATKPSNTSPPVISGSAQEGSTLTASDGTWSGSTPISYRFQWRICSSLGGGCTAITGETAQTYAVTADDVGNTLDVLVTASNTAGSGFAVSAVTAKVSAAPTTTTTPAPTATVVTVTAEAVTPFTFTLSTVTQRNIVSDTPGAAELNVPPGTVTFTVSNPYANINSHTFEICTTPLAKPVTTLPGVQKLPNSCTGEVTPLLAPGGAIATLMVDFTTPGAYEYLSTANNPKGNAYSGMKGVLNVT